MPDPSGDFVHHIVVVRDQQDGSVVFLKRNIQGVDRFQIQVVRWLVQQQEIRFLEHQAAENKTRRFPARKIFCPFGRILSAK